MTIPALPSFADLQAQQNQSQPPTQPPGTLGSPSGGEATPPAPVSQPGGGSPPLSYLAELEQQGKVPPGQFKTERELIDALYGTAENLATRVEEYETQQSSAPPQTPEPPPPTTAPAVPSPAELTKMATVFQQNGWLALKEGQWVAVNPMASQVAQQMNNAIMESQARQLEMTGDPEAYISKYGEGVFKKHLDPLNDQITQLKEQNQRLQSQIEANTPRADKTWVEQNRDKLFVKDATGAETHTPAGKAYAEAWEMARLAGQPLDKIHTYALTVATPLINASTPPTAPAPVQSWAQQAAQRQPTDPSFNAPGTVLNNSVPPNGIGIPTGNDGYPTFGSLQALGLQS